ncbi:AhpC-TSA domain-containing protein [Candidatus Nitrotoga sp. HW29]|uniref:TlpA family protein disulfide reductase n=1 Tax=Candidatus Nitrotoga sp. HW29 TaxID=2886963 RepID=UPI001EF1EBC9|nr:TlpA disulfide reductase family protein [Candidatus Nitrotoga sp. HW29]CAH1905639.1 AhpC-TSA domain-containing protein [Candidatus Nitrotoga sp. HW29]
MKSGGTIAQCLLGLLLCLSSACASAAQIVKHFVHGSYQQIVSARAGKPFIISLWSLDCTYCRDDMVLFGKLSKKFPDLDLVLISTDTPDQTKEIARTLQKYPLKKAESWVFADSFVERLRYEVDTQWYGELPRTYFYDAQGHVLALSGRLDYAQIERWIRASKKNE